MNAFLAMGGYAAFVWPAYALGAAVFAWNIWAARRLHARALARAIRRAASGGESRAP